MFITYKITNLITNQYYIGSHKTNNLDDGYMGSGVLIKKSIAEYGLTNHQKDILGLFETREDSLDLEHKLIKEAKDCSDPLILNKSFGGYSFDFINSNLSFDRASFGKLASHDYAHNLRAENIEAYNTNPKLCKHCSKPLDYDRRWNDFCNSSCAASYNNTRKIYKKRNQVMNKTCEFCQNKFQTQRKDSRFCCNKCSCRYREMYRSKTPLQLKLLEDKDIIMKRHESESYTQIAKSYDCSSNMIKELCKGRIK